MLHTERISNNDLNYHVHEFNKEDTECHISLPKNADTEFISAEHISGILRLFTPKARILVGMPILYLLLINLIWKPMTTINS